MAGPAHNLAGVSHATGLDSVDTYFYKGVLENGSLRPTTDVERQAVDHSMRNHCMPGSGNHRDCRDMLYITQGINFRFLPKDAMEAIIEIDLDFDFRTKRSMISKPSIGKWWESLEQRLRATDVEDDNEYAECDPETMPRALGSGPSNKSLTAMDAPVASHKPRTLDSTVHLNFMRGPFHDLGDEMSKKVGSLRFNLSQLRRNLANVHTETCTLGYDIQQQGLSRMLNIVGNNPELTEGSRAVCNYITDFSNGFFGNDPNRIRRNWSHRSFAPDMEPALQQFQLTMIHLELLGVSVSHGPTYYLQLTHLCAMNPELGLYPNSNVLGPGGSGKSYAFGLIVANFIKGTIREEQYESMMAPLSYERATMHETVIKHEFTRMQNKGGSNQKTNHAADAYTAAFKSICTENRVTTATQTVKDGVRRTVRYEGLRAITQHCVSNMASEVDFGDEASRTRVEPITFLTKLVIVTIMP